MNVLVGYTGFVGSNLYELGEFDYVFNSKNIEEAYGLNPDLLVYSGIRAEKYLANMNPKKDEESILEAEKNIIRINPRKIVLISTIDVFKEPKNVDEDSEIDLEGLNAYGRNRYQLEVWVRNRYPDALIVRLPGLFGKNIKKNFIFDLINFIPSMLTSNKYTELINKESKLRNFYEKTEEGFYKADIPNNKREEIKELFKELGFSALSFTDHRSSYQFYNLKRLWADICLCLEKDITLIHLATEPVTAGEVYEYILSEKFNNKLTLPIAQYDYRTKHAKLFGESGSYIVKRQQILKEIKEFVENEQ